MLVLWQRSRGRGRGAIPSLPIGVTMRPVGAPYPVPAWRRIDRPTTEHRGPIQVIANWNAQNEERHAINGDEIPWTVEPGAGVPCVVYVNPIESIIEEVIRMQAWCVIHRVAGNPLQGRVLDYVNGYVDTGLRGRRHEVESSHREYGD